MGKKLALAFISLILASVIFSGCIFDKKPEQHLSTGQGAVDNKVQPPKDGGATSGRDDPLAIASDDFLKIDANDFG